MSYGGGAKCAVCEKAVYHNDPKISADGKTWHASCFKCKECKSNITLAKWVQLDGENFCKPCYKKVFMLRGEYSDVGGSAPTFAGSTATATAGEGGAGESATTSAAAAAPPYTAPAPAPAAAAKVASPAPKPTGTTPAPAGESKFGGGAKCPVCAKSVYAAEPSVAADGNKFHAACFRCLECKAQLTLAKWCVCCAVSSFCCGWAFCLLSAQFIRPLPPVNFFCLSLSVHSSLFFLHARAQLQGPA